MADIPSYGDSISHREIKDRLHYRENMLDLWERDLRSREEALLEERFGTVYHNSTRNNRSFHNRSNNFNRRRRKKRRREDIDYSIFADRSHVNRMEVNESQQAPNFTSSGSMDGNVSNKDHT